MTPLRQAPEDLRGRAIVIVVIAATVISVVAIAVAWWMTPAGLHEGARLVSDPRAISGSEQSPLLEAPSRSAITQARERARLEGYAPIDGQRARIPIARAIELLLSGRRPEGAGAAAFSPPAEAR